MVAIDVKHSLETPIEVTDASSVLGAARRAARAIDAGARATGSQKGKIAGRTWIDAGELKVGDYVGLRDPDRKS